MKNNIMKFLSVIVFILSPVIISLAQPPFPGSGSHALDPSLNGMPGAGAPTMGCNGPAGAPIGNGYWILLVLALSYGVYKIWQMREAEKSTCTVDE
jgi:hypothetical protein